MRLFKEIEKSFYKVKKLLTKEQLLECAATAETFSSHPIALSIMKAYGKAYGNKIDESGSRENRFIIDGNINKPVSSTMGVGVSGLVRIYSYTDEVFKSLNEDMTNYWTFSLNPYIYMEGGNMNLLLGAKIDVEVRGREKITPSPAIRFNYYPSERFMFYLLAEGGRKDNSQYNLFYENRYVDPLIRVMDSRSSLDATAGIKFTPLSTLSVGIFGGYKITKDEHFFCPNYMKIDWGVSALPMLAGNWITPIYEDANTLKFGADLKYAYQNVFELGLKGTYYNWTFVDTTSLVSSFIPIKKAWNKPDFEISANAAYKLPTLPLRFDLSYLGAYGRKAANGRYPNEILKMDDIHDLSLKGTYSITPNFSAYIKLNNLLFSKYDLWWGYPAQGFNVMGGLSVLF